MERLVTLVTRYSHHGYPLQSPWLPVTVTIVTRYSHHGYRVIVTMVTG